MYPLLTHLLIVQNLEEAKRWGKNIHGFTTLRQSILIVSRLEGILPADCFSNLLHFYEELGEKKSIFLLLLCMCIYVCAHTHKNKVASFTYRCILRVGFHFGCDMDGPC